MWLSNANSNAIVITDLVQPELAEKSLDALFPAPTSRAEARSNVRFGLEASCIIFNALIKKLINRHGEMNFLRNN
jgi:hypothetical protein